MPGLVSIIIPNWNKKELLRLCVRSLEAQRYRPLEVIVVDNGSADGSVDMIRAEFPDARLITFHENRGFSAAVNAGVREAGGGLIALINNDAEADPGWVLKLVEAAEANPGAGFFASKILFYSDKETVDAFGDGFTAAGFGYKHGFGEPAGSHVDARYVLGACGGGALYRRNMLDELGYGGEYFDEDFFAFGEDLDLSLRAQSRGYKCLAVPDALVYHRVRATAGRGSAYSLFLSHRNFILTVMKNFPPGVILRNLPGMAAYLFLAALADALRNRRALYLRSYVAALGMWPKMKPKRKSALSAMKITPAAFRALLDRRWFSIWLRLGRMNRAVGERGL